MSAKHVYTDSVGNGALWKRFELYNINERIENLYNHFKQYELRKASDSDSKDNSDLSSEESIRSMIGAQLSETMEFLNSKYNEKTSDLRNENLSLKNEIRSLKSKVNDSNKKCSNYENEMDLQMKKFEKLKNGFSDFIKSDKKTFLSQIDGLKKKLSDGEAQRSELNGKYLDLKRNHKNEISGLKDELDNLKQKCMDLQKENTAVLYEKRRYEMRCESIDKMMSVCNKNDENGLQRKLSETEADLDNLKRKMAKLVAKNEKIETHLRALKLRYKNEKEAVAKMISDKNYDRIVSQSPNNKDRKKHENELLQIQNEMNEYWKSELLKREKTWKMAKKEAVTTLDSEYKILRAALNERVAGLEGKCSENDRLLRDLNGINKRLSDENKKLTSDLRAQNKEMFGFPSKLNGLYSRVSERDKRLLELQRELSQYKIVWQHCNGISSPLKETIRETKHKLDQFEGDYKIESPIPRKRRKKLAIDSLLNWKLQWESSKYDLPLQMDNAPLPNCEYQRFELFNGHRDTIELRGFCLKNMRGDTIQLDGRMIRPGHSIGICLRKKMKNNDILCDCKGFVDFGKETENNKIYLCDSFDSKEQIFPSLAVREISNLSDNCIDGVCPIELMTIFARDEDGFDGFEFVNTTGMRLRFTNIYFTNSMNSFKKALPRDNVIDIDGKIRIIITDTTNDNNNNNRNAIKENDIVIGMNTIIKGRDDALLICDDYQNQFELYNHKDTYDTDDDDDDDNTMNDSDETPQCYVM